MTVMPHWSATRFMLFDQCPTAFKERYVDEVPLQPTEALCFGQAVHMGLEAHYNAQDGDRAFRAAWKELSRTDLGGVVDHRLTGVGLQLLEQVVALDLHGIPEYGFSLDTNMDLGAPIVGAMDLWDQDANVIYDFKTTRGHWSAERAQTEVYQPLLYTWAAWTLTDQWPAFEYIVCHRVTGTLDRFRRQWTEDQWLAQMNACWRRMRLVACLVAADVFTCWEKHGNCPECGVRWTHGHVCEDTARLRRVRL
jgi:hypothetical protein